MPIKPKYRGIYTESLWKSVVVKSLRCGWPAGLQAAEQVLPPSMMKYLLVSGILEDILPAIDELPTIMTEIEDRNYVALCHRQTHHARGFTDEYLRLVEAAEKTVDRRATKIRGQMQEMGCWQFLTRPMLLMASAWLKLRPTDGEVKRAEYVHPWAGLPRVMADVHTYEGIRMGQRSTILSGTFQQHRELARTVPVSGWDAVCNAADFDDTFDRGVSESELMANENAVAKWKQKQPRVRRISKFHYTVEGSQLYHEYVKHIDGQTFIRCTCRAIGRPCYPAVAALMVFKKEGNGNG